MMKFIGKVPAMAGAQWWLDSIQLILKAPRSIWLLGVMYAVLSMVPIISIFWNNILFSGLIWAMALLDQNQKDFKSDILWTSFKQNKWHGLVTLLLPQLVFLFIFMMLLSSLIGEEGLKIIVEASKKIEAISYSQKQPTQEELQAIINSLPWEGIFRSAIVFLVGFIIFNLIVFIAIPQIIFSKHTGRETMQLAFFAMKYSFLFCIKNTPAILMCILFGGIVFFAVLMAVYFVFFILQFILAQAALLVMQILFLSIIKPLWAGVVYFAWKSAFNVSISVKNKEPDTDSYQPTQVEL